MSRETTVKNVKASEQFLTIQLAVLMKVVSYALSDLLITTQDYCTHAHEYLDVTSDKFDW